MVGGMGVGVAVGVGVGRADLEIVGVGSSIFPLKFSRMKSLAPL